MPRTRATSDSPALSTLVSSLLRPLGISADDLRRLHLVPLLAGLVGVLINVLLLASRHQTAWISGSALYDGQPLSVSASLAYAAFGSRGVDTHLVSTVCGGDELCSLDALCEFVPVAAVMTYANGAPRFSNPQLWCDLRDAGAAAQGTLWLGFIPGLAAALLTLLYAARDLPTVSHFNKTRVDLMLSDLMQRLSLAVAWGALWLFLFVSLAEYAALAPESLGVGPVAFGASFGIVRLALLLAMVAGSLLVASLFELWSSGTLLEMWAEFVETGLLSPKKALYVELMAQLVLYLLASLQSVRWEILLVVICFYYLDAKVRNCMLLYVVFVTTSILFDVITLASMGKYEAMSAGERFVNSVFVLIFLLKFCILGTIYFYEKELETHPEGYFRHSIEDGVDGREDEIAE